MSSRKDKISKLLADSLSSANVKKEGAQVENVLGRFLESSSIPQSRHLTESSLLTETPPDNSQSSLLTESSHIPQSSQPTINLMDSLPDVKGFLKLYFQIIDHLYPQLDPFERAAHETLYRLSWGFNRPTCTISYQRIAERTNMSRASAHRAVAKLIKKGLVSKTNTVLGFGKEQGIEFRVVPAPRHLTESRHLPQSRLLSQIPMIDNNINSTQTQPRVSGEGKSEYDLNTCIRFAESLKSEGITNPKGYATAIYRSGEADEMITEWLKPKVDVSQCPDCRGTGWVYPEGFEKGAKQCQHPRLKEGK